MPKTKTVRVAFSEAKIADNENRSLEQVLENVTALPLGMARTVNHRGQMLHLKTLHRDHTEGYWIGDVSKISIDDPIVISDLSGAEEEIGGAGDRGATNKTAFLYYPPARTFIAPVHTSGPSESAIAGCIKGLGRLQSMELQMILEPGALERLMRMDTFLQLRIAISGLGQQPIDQEVSAANHIFETLRDMNSPQAAFNFKIRRREGSLNNVKELVRALLGSNREAVTKLIVVGSEGHADEKSTVNLFEDRMIEPIRIDLAEGDRITNDVRYDCLKSAFRARREQLDQYITG